MILIARSTQGFYIRPVTSVEEASEMMRAWIELNGFGAGCSNRGPSFISAKVKADKKDVATISYNGRINMI